MADRLSFSSSWLQAQRHAQCPNLRTHRDFYGFHHLEVASPRQNFLQGDRQLESGQSRARTVVGTTTEGHMILDIRTTQNELIRIREHRLVAICG
jgi:hypothetical protein